MKLILKNPEEHPMSGDMEQVVTIEMIYDAETLKNELVEDEIALHLRTKSRRQLKHLSEVRTSNTPIHLSLKLVSAHEDSSYQMPAVVWQRRKGVAIYWDG